MPLRFVALVPARMASSRLPDKPLALIGGIPMVIRVARQAHVTRDVPISSAKLDAPAAHAAKKAALDAPSAAPSDASAPRAAHDKEAAPAPASA
jgi:3-deoxy-manno-octulosonate cytidylyltransferase (CMP-KDO synthetase)